MAQYDSSSIEKRWEEMWKKEEIYRFDPKSDKPVFSIDNPPRYTSGSLHLGHATGYSLIDFAARYKRMRGYNVFFPLCFDVNGTPIEVKVEKKHGITKLDTPRQEYRRLCEEYANGFIEEMTHHFEILGESMDPSIYYQTDATTRPTPPTTGGSPSSRSWSCSTGASSTRRTSPSTGAPGA